MISSLTNILDVIKSGTSSNIPLVLQSESAECGLACIAMIASYYGYKTDLTSLRYSVSISSNGLNIKHLIDISSRLKLSGRAIKIDIDNLSNLEMPCILHWDLNHFVVLKSTSNGKVFINDPALGEVSYSIDEFSGYFTGIALEITPTIDFEQKDERVKLKIHQLWSNIVGLKRTIIQVLILSVLLQVFLLINPFFMQTVVDDVLLRDDQHLLSILALGFFLLLLIQVATEGLRSLIITNVSYKLNAQMSSNLFHHLIRLPLSYFQKRHIGDTVSRFSSLDTIKTTLSTGVVTVFVDGLMAMSTLFMLAFYSVKLTLVILLISFCYALVKYSLYRPIKKFTAASISAHANERSNFIETIRAAQSIKVFQKENDRQNLWHNYLSKSINEDIRLSHWNIGFVSFKTILFGVENIVIIYLAANLVINEEISLGILYAIISYKTQFLLRMESLINNWIEFKMLSLHLERLSDIAFTPKDTLTNFSCCNNEEISGDLVVKDLSFRYSDVEDEAFSNIGFTVSEGESVAIVGSSGCGKTTLIKCMMGLLKPSKGRVLVNGIDIMNSSAYRKSISAVMQDDQLVSGTILDNIAFFEPEVNISWVHECARLAGIHDDILQMPMNYRTLISDMGVSVSGGQKQRLLLARALYRRPKILFLDEATSQLDLYNERLVNEHISKLKITRIIVAHRKETIESADRAILLG